MAEPAAVLDLQRLDNTLDQLRYRHEHLPERSELRALEEQLATLARATERTRAQRDDLRRRDRALEDDAVDLETKATKLEAKLYDGTVTSPKEATALGDEVKGLRSRQTEIEDQAIEILEQIEPLDAQLVQAEAAAGELEAKRRTVAERLSAAIETLESEIAGVEARRHDAAAQLEPSLREQYDRLRITYGPDAIVEFDPAHGGGCPVAMSAVELDRWKHSPAGTVDNCVDCGRLVVKLA